MDKQEKAVRRGWLHWALLLAAPVWVQAAPPGWVAVEPTTLDVMRGGFTLASGLQVSLGLEQLLMLNGEVIARKQLDIGSLSDRGGAEGAVALLQNGSGNTMLSGFSADSGAGMVIQNTLNDQQIGSRTIINASVNSSALLDTLNFHSQLSDALARAVATH